MIGWPTYVHSARVVTAHGDVFGGVALAGGLKGGVFFCFFFLGYFQNLAVSG